MSSCVLCGGRVRRATQLCLSTKRVSIGANCDCKCRCLRLGMLVRVSQSTPDKEVVEQQFIVDGLLQLNSILIGTLMAVSRDKQDERHPSSLPRKWTPSRVPRPID